MRIFNLPVKWKHSGPEEIVLTSWEINRSGWLPEEWSEVREHDRRCGEE